MLVCANCGKENAPDSRFCSACGAALATAEPARGEVRKTVTIVFSDVVGSTSVGERLDPETTRRVMGRYFDAMATVVERHGGTVEKFIGDAIMAVFGIPHLHEDDALRAVRAAAEMRQRLGELNAELERDFGVWIETRTGVNTGEVVAGQGQTLATGDAVNTAARLEQAARAGEILVGEATVRLVRDAVEAEPAEPVEAKGKADPVAAYRLTRVVEGAEPFARRFESPLVGRERELTLLAEAYRRSVDERACHLFTILGAAGIGKSRLVQELLAGLGDDATILVGRCLSYGEGITYWPLVEMLEELGSGDRIVQLLEGEPEARAIVNRVLAAVGLADAEGAPEETPWAVRKLLEAFAREQPLVVVLDDLQWAEPTFLELVEHIADWSRDAPILLVCLARPELLDERQAWGGGKLNATTILLEPLAAEDAGALIDNLLARTVLPERTRTQVADAAEGNPLFVEQMLAMLAEGGTNAREVVVPPTIQALLAARIDRLERGERDAIERASVVGREFWRRAVTELSSEPTAIPAALQGLVRKELVRPHRSASFPRDDAFRFRHLLIRDAAYAGLPKELRADLHERFAGWLEAERSEYDEIVGYHLEQAYRYRAELGPLDGAARDLGRRAGERLAAAGERAFGRSDMPAAEKLLERALDLLPAEHPRRRELRLDHAEAVAVTGGLERARHLFHDLVHDATRVGEAKVEWRARVSLALIQLLTDDLSAEDAAALAGKAMMVFTELGDDAGLARAYRLEGDACNIKGDGTGLEAAIRQGLVHAARAGDVRLETECMSWLGVSQFFGPSSVSEATATLEQIERAASTPLQRAHALLWRSAIRGLQGDTAARAGAAAARETYADLGLKLEYASTSQPHAMLELLADNPAGAEQVLRDASAELAQAGERGHRSTVVGMLGLALLRQERYEEADEAVREATALTSADDVVNFGLIAALRAGIAAWRGSAEQVEQEARAAISLADKAGSPVFYGDVALTVAEALHQVGRTAAARKAASAAVAAYEKKGVVQGAERGRQFLAELAAA